MSAGISYFNFYIFIVQEEIQSVSPWKEVDKGTLGRRWDEASPQVWTLEAVAHVVGAARDVDVGVQLQQLAAFQSHTFLELGNCTPKNKQTYQKGQFLRGRNSARAKMKYTLPFLFGVN